MKKYVVIYERTDESDSAYVPDLPSCIAAAGTREETEKLIKEAIELYIPQLKANGQPIPEPTTSANAVSVTA